VSLADARGTLPMDKLLEMRLDGVAFDHMATVYEEYTGKIAIENLRPSWLIFSGGFRKGRLLQTGKRLLDLAAALIGVILALPLMILVALAVRLDSPGPVLYRQQRVGQHGRLFNLFKFRSMRQDAEAKTGAVWCAEQDPRITRIGRFIRKARLDEIPQLWNVLRGDMSLVGPRPERPEFVESLAREIPFYGQRHTVKPGLTGWAQVSYSYAGSVGGTMEKLQYDLFYIKNLSLPLDLFIMFCTAKIVLLGKGAR
jgi:sugar transferase (PEP-CTERM system associated)